MVEQNQVEQVLGDALGLLVDRDDGGAADEQVVAAVEGDRQVAGDRDEGGVALVRGKLDPGGVRVAQSVVRAVGPADFADRR